MRKAFNKYRTLTRRSGLDDQVKNLIRQWSNRSVEYKERFLVMHGNSMVPVLASEIGYFQKDQIIFLHSLQGEKFVCEFGALDDIESLLNPARFFRVNRQYIIHIQSVAKIKNNA